MEKLSIEDLDMRGRIVLMRVDFNVPLDRGRVVSDKRIRAAIPSIRHVIEAGGRLILISHLGRPKGRPVVEMSLEPCAGALGRLIDRSVEFVSDCQGPAVKSAVEVLQPGSVLMLENLRFYSQETENDAEFSRQLAALADMYVNDAFGTAHRAHASTVGVTRFLAPCAAGYLMKKELDYFAALLTDYRRPFVAILGGAKVSGKIEVIEHLLPKVDRLLVGGGMAFTFLRARGFEIGRSLLEPEKLSLAEDLMRAAGEKIFLPEDCVVTEALDLSTRTVGPLSAVDAGAIPPEARGVDIGPRTVSRFQEELKTARTVVWNGPMGIFEIPAAAAGTFAVARALAAATQAGATTVVGGGDSAAAIQAAGAAEDVSHVSTGGGASLELLQGRKLPGVEALTDRPAA